MKLMPIESCKECKFLGKEINCSPKRYKTFCTYPDFKIRYSKMIYLSGHECTSHYIFPEWCSLKNEEL